MHLRQPLTSSETSAGRCTVQPFPESTSAKINQLAEEFEPDG
ncbi:MAG: hypothetical protein ACFE0J_14540 [Elainellaceae cyanobacterium]